MRGYALAKLSRGNDLAKAFNYILKRWPSFPLFQSASALDPSEGFVIA